MAEHGLVNGDGVSGGGAGPRPAGPTGSVIWRSLAMASLLVCGDAIAGDMDRNERFLSCIGAGMESLVSGRSRDFSSPQYRVVCDLSAIVEEPPGCRIFERAESFTYEAPANFRIDDARFEITVKTAGTSIGELRSGDRRATIDLQCRGHPCTEIQGHKSVAGTITGRIVYQPTAEDVKEIAGDCHTRMLLQ